jgi:hypothetical protein
MSDHDDLVDSMTWAKKYQEAWEREVVWEKRVAFAAFLSILFMEFGVVFIHTFAAAGHEHWTQAPLASFLPPLFNWFHIASALSHWPIGIFVCVLCFGARRWWMWIVTAVSSELVWITVKTWAGKDWPMWWQQIGAWI